MMSCWRSQSRTDVSSSGLEMEIPALLTTRSRPPKARLPAATPALIASSSAKASQAHQVRLLAAELGPDGIRVNGINPDGVVRGSGIFSGGWGADRAKVYGVDEEQLGEYYAQRTLLKREILPEHVAEAVLALTGGSLEVTTGLLIPVDGGVPMGFLR